MELIFIDHSQKRAIRREAELRAICQKTKSPLAIHNFKSYSNKTTTLRS